MNYNKNKSFRLEDGVASMIKQALEESKLSTYNDLFKQMFGSKKSKTNKSKVIKSKEINEDLDYLYSKINWGASFLDAKAVTIMNELSGKIRDLEKQHDQGQRD